MTDAERTPDPGMRPDLPGPVFGIDEEELPDFPDAPPPYRSAPQARAPIPETETVPVPEPETYGEPESPEYWPAPPRERVEAELAEGRKGKRTPPPPVESRPLPVPPDAPRVSRRPWALPLAALAAAAALTAGVLVVDRALTPQNPFLEGGTEFAAAGAGGVTGIVRLVPTGTGTGVVLEPENLPPAAEGSYYAAWLRAPDGRTVPLGSFHERRTNIPIFLWSAVVPADYPELLVTEQSENDQPAPTGPVVLTARLG